MNPEQDQQGTGISADNPIRDLSDFCRRWPELRMLVERSLYADPRDGSEDIEKARQIVNWLCLLADRVCMED